MDDNCIFCKIIAGQIPAQKEYEDEQLVAFRDVKPAAPVHVLVVPKSHIPNLESIDDQIEVLGKLQALVGQLAKGLSIQAGYKVILNAGRFQEVPHLHYHLLGGWPHDAKALRGKQEGGMK